MRVMWILIHSRFLCVYLDPKILSLQPKLKGVCGVWPFNACNKVATGRVCHIRSLEMVPAEGNGDLQTLI